MKLGIKYLLAAAIGYLYAAFIPLFSEHIEWVHSASDIILLLIPWILYPLVFFTLASAAAFVKQQGQLAGLTLRVLLWSAVSHLMLVALGAVIASQVSASPILPGITAEGLTMNQFIEIRDVLSLRKLPLWAVLAGGIITGFALQPRDERYSYGYHVMNSLGEVFFRIARCSSEFLSLGIVALTGVLVYQVKDTPLFTQQHVLLLIALLTSLIGVLLILPLMTMIFCTRRHPFRWLVSLAAPYFAAVISGSYILGSVPLYGSARSNVGAARSVTSVTLPAFSIFGRGGTAMVTAILAVTILSFYQGGMISAIQVMMVAGLSIAASLTVFLVPGMELSFCLMLVLTMAGIDLPQAAGFAVSSILLKGAAASLDIMISGMGTGYTAQMLDAEIRTNWKEMQ